MVEKSSNRNHPDIAVRYVEGKGRGVFAERRFLKGQIIERAPVIVLPENQWELLNQTALKDYYFTWGEDACAVPLGLSMIYNHSDHPNATATRHVQAAVIEFVALRDIEAGEEITHKYSCPPWFEIKE